MQFSEDSGSDRMGGKPNWVYLLVTLIFELDKLPSTETLQTYHISVVT